MKSLINIEDFNEIVKGIKAMKADLVYVKGKELFGTDNGFTMLKHYTMPNIIPVEPFTIITKTLSSEFFNNIIDVYLTIDTDINKIYCPGTESRFVEYPNMININCNQRIESIISNLNRDLYSSMTKQIQFDEITNDEHFQRFKTIKAGEGADLYNPFGNTEFGMYLYSGSLPMVKADKIYLNCYDLGNTFIAEYIIQKKKIGPIFLYFKYVKLQKNYV